MEDLSSGIAKSSKEVPALTKKWAEFQMDEAVNQYKDYFESDHDEDISLLEQAKHFDKETLLGMYENVI